MTPDVVLLLLAAALWGAHRLVVTVRDENRRIERLIAEFEPEKDTVAQ